MGRLGIELSALSAQELKRLLEVARARGQEALAQQLTAELQSRTAAWRPPPAVMTHARTPETPADRPAPAPSRSARASVAAGLAGLVIAGVAWGLTVPIGLEQLAGVRPESPPPVRLAVALTSGRAPAAVEAPAPPAHEPDIAPIQVTRVSPPRAHNPCYDEPTAAARLVCGFPALAERHRRMLSAYDSARAAGVDALALDSAQAAWRQRTNNVSDRHLLADLYEQRIRELRADAAAARENSPPF